tara:strand:- start:2773 stop:4155 length:1383 start_codon:yes stop_codon:yes gene_type:complete
MDYKDYKKVGEGSSGCVIKPAIKCSDKQPKGYEDKQPSTYENKLSKLMDEDDAVYEFKETTNLADIDGIEQYAIVKPHLCKPVDDGNLENIIKDNCTDTSELNKLVNDIGVEFVSQLLLEDGGISLHYFPSQLYPSLTYNSKIDFFKSILNLFDGLKFFREKNIIHHDIKLANIVYNIETKTCKYIDFGLVHDRNDLRSKMDLDDDSLSMSWKYYPHENECRSLGKFLSSNCNDYREIYKELVKKEISKKVKNQYVPNDSDLQQLAYEKLRNWVLDSFDQYCLCLALRNLCQEIRKNENDENILAFLREFEVIVFKQSKNPIKPETLRYLKRKNNANAPTPTEYEELNPEEKKKLITILLKQRERDFDLQKNVIEPYQKLLTTLESKSTSSNEKEETKEEEDKPLKLPSLRQRMSKKGFDGLPSLIGGGTKKKFPRKKKNKRKTKKQKTKRRKRTTMKKK